MDDQRRDGGTNSTLRIKEQGMHLTLNEHDDDDDNDDDNDFRSLTAEFAYPPISKIYFYLFFVYLACIFIVYYLFVPTKCTHIH